ncbi:MAG: trigger factor [Bacteroidaceae bacterium]|nr:trigger factor [Bacteroidaceae bacterium]
MNVSLQNIDKVSALLTVKIEKIDYQEKVEQSLRKARQKAQMPGFRKGMVPKAMINKLYGKSILAEEVDKILNDKVYDYIKENKLKVLGQPLSNEEKQSKIDFDTMEEFEFTFDLALAPDFDVTVTKEDRVNYYTIEVTDKMVDAEVENYTRRNGKNEDVDIYKDNDIVEGLLVQLDEKGNTIEKGIQVESAQIMPSYFKNDEQKMLFADAKVDDVLTINPYSAYEANAVGLASLLKIDKTVAADVKSNFTFQIKKISRFIPGDLTQEIFDQVYGKDVVKSEEEFRAKIKEGLVQGFIPEGNYKFLMDVRKVLSDKVGKLEFSEKLLKRMILENNKDKGEEFVSKKFEESINELSWQLIKDKLVEAAGLKIEQSDIIETAKNAARAQFAQYGMHSVPDDVLTNYVQEMLKKKESVENLYNRAIEEKLTEDLKSKVTLENKTVSLEEFNKMFE